VKSARKAENHLAVARGARKVEMLEDAAEAPTTAAAAFSGLNGHVRGPRPLARDTEIEVRDAAIFRVGFVRKQQQAEQRRKKQGFHNEDTIVETGEKESGEK
jgi:hypothetical protein